MRSLYLYGEEMGRSKDATTVRFAKVNGSQSALQALLSLSVMFVPQFAQTVQLIMMESVLDQGWTL